MTAARGPAVIRRRLGGALKQLRNERGLHLQMVAQQMEMSPSKLSRLETGQVTPRIRDVRDLLEIYGAPQDRRDRILEWAEEAKEPGWWQPFSATITAYLELLISLEAEARRIRMYSLPVSGLLQTEAYARMMFSGAAPNATAEERERLIQIRIRRQVVVDPQRADAPPIDLHVVLDEAALHRGNEPSIMVEQLDELLRRSQWSHVKMQVLPFKAGFAVPAGTFAIFDPRDTDDGVVVNVESAGQDAYFDTAGEIAKYEQMWQSVAGLALDPEQSAELLRAVRASHAAIRTPRS